MLEIDMSGQLNALDTEIHKILTEECQKNEKLTIVEASEICHCSPSKISKFVKKLGFQNYKQYRDYICKRQPVTKTFSDEFARIRHFLDTFDQSLINRFISEIRQYKKIVLVGYGPSKYCAQYFQFKLQLFSSQTIIVSEDELAAASVIDSDTIVVIFSATGTYDSFRNYKRVAKEKGAQLLLLVEEYNTSIIPDYGQIIFLTDTFQTLSPIAYEKSRIIFFIFIEEVIARYVKERA